MKRGIITNNEQGIHISYGEIWMTSWELADLFYTTAGTVHAAIKRILKTNGLKNHEVCKYTGHSAAFRKWVTNKVARNQDYNLLLYLNKGTNHTLYC